MSNTARAGLVVLLLMLPIFIVRAHAQRPPEADAAGTLFLPVNINPTDVAPMVNINPHGTVPRVELNRVPDVRVTPSGCQSRQNFQTGIGRSIAGPLMITYLHLPPQQTTVTLGDPAGSHSMNLGSGGQITTAIFLQANQRLEFDSEIMYSGCRPE
jgi:hypothetical protein